LIFPKNLGIIFEEGTSFLLDHNISMIVQSDLKINGSEDSPVKISRLFEDKPFGVFGVLGKEKKIDVDIRYLEISGGNESMVQGVKFLGQLSIHNSNTTLFNTLVKGSISDDGLNIRNSEVKIINSQFVDNFADQVDLDFCNGIVKGSYFSMEINNDSSDHNGDGFDVSGSKIILEENKFSGFKDKGVSVGENSNVLFRNNYFSNNNNAITVKDGSNAYLLDNTYESNNYVFSIYIKKPFYSKPKLYTSSDIKDSEINNLIDGLEPVVFKNIPNEFIISDYESK
jgi:hypothetical protein